MLPPKRSGARPPNIFFLEPPLEGERREEEGVRGGDRRGPPALIYDLPLHRDSGEMLSMTKQQQKQEMLLIGLPDYRAC